MCWRGTTANGGRTTRVMATAGSVIGAYLTYRIARNGGEKALKERFSPRNVKKVTKAFERWGFGAIVIPAFLPPPMPMVPFVIAAGALQYSTKKFLAAISAGRLVRYCILAYLGAAYGRKIFKVILAHGRAVLIVTIAWWCSPRSCWWFSCTFGESAEALAESGI